MQPNNIATYETIPKLTFLVYFGWNYVLFDDFSSNCSYQSSSFFTIFKQILPKKIQSIIDYLKIVTKCKTITKNTCLRSFLTKWCEFWVFSVNGGHFVKMSVFEDFAKNYQKRIFFIIGLNIVQNRLILMKTDWTC